MPDPDDDPAQPDDLPADPNGAQAAPSEPDAAPSDAVADVAAAATDALAEEALASEVQADSPTGTVRYEAPAGNGEPPLWRAFALAAGLVALFAWLIPWNDWFLENTQLAANYFPAILPLALLLMVLVVNPVLGAKRFRQRELAIVAIALLGLGGVVSGGMMRLLPTAIAGPAEMLSAPAPRYAPIQEAVADGDPAQDPWRWAMPEGMTIGIPDQGPIDPLDDQHEAEIDRFYHGPPLEERGEPPAIPWGAWFASLLNWSPALVAAAAGMLCIAALVRYQWIMNERLTYPLGQIMLSLTEDPKPGRRFPALFAHKGFWAAVAIVCFISVWRGFHVWGIVPLDIPMKLQLWGTVMTGDPWSRMPIPHFVGQPQVVFSVVAIAFLVTAEVSFSMWFTFIAMNLLWMWLSLSGVPVVRRDYEDLANGGFLAMAVVILFLGRQHYWRSLRAAIGLDKTPAAVAAAPYVWGLIASSVVLLAFLLYQGADLMPSLLMMLIFFGGLLVLARIVAETGLPFIQTAWTGRVNDVLFGLFGGGDSARSLTPVALVGFALGGDNRTALLPHAVNADYLGAKSGVGGKRTSLILAGAVLLGGLIAFVAMIAVGYAKGLNVDGYHLVTLQDLVMEPVARLAGASDSAAAMDQLAATQGKTLRGFGIGAGVVLMLAFCRMRLPWWPLHPVGFVLMASYTAFAAWASIMLGWLIKVLILRYGGNRLYVALKPVAIGLLVGEAAMILLFAAIRAVAAMMGNQLEPVHLIPL